MASEEKERKRWLKLAGIRFRAWLTLDLNITHTYVYAVL